MLQQQVALTSGLIHGVCTVNRTLSIKHFVALIHGVGDAVGVCSCVCFRTVSRCQSQNMFYTQTLSKATRIKLMLLYMCIVLYNGGGGGAVEGGGGGSPCQLIE